MPSVFEAGTEALCGWSPGLSYPYLIMPATLPQSRHHHTYEEYLVLERDSETKHEFVAGEILAMAGGSRRHNALAARITAAIEVARRPGCTAFTSDQRIRILGTGLATYPDVSVVCGSIEGDPDDRSGQTITNPLLLVEVLSASTESADRGYKWEQYQRIPALQEYVLVSQTSPRVEIYRRLTSDQWEHFDVREGIVTLASGATIDLSVLYADLPA